MGAKNSKIYLSAYILLCGMELNSLLFSKSSRKLFLKENFIRSKIKHFLWKSLFRVENWSNATQETNGEHFFLGHIETSTPIVFFDVGANVGSYTRQILSQNPYAIGHVFEPSPKSFDFLKKEFGSKQNIYLQNVAVSSSPGEADLYYEEEGSSWSSLYKRDISEYGLSMDKSSSVKKITLEEYIEQTKLTHVDLIKIDVEGHELEVLKGMGRFLSPHFVDCIQFEYGECSIDSRIYLRDIYKLLEPAEFVIYKIMPNGLLHCRYRLILENHQYANFVAIARKHDAAFL